MAETRLSTIDQKAIDELIDWMVDGARPSANAHEIISGICKGLVAAGVPIDRFALFIYTLHPNMIGWRFTWTPEKGVERSEGPIGLFSTEQYTANPLPTVIARQISIRRRLADPDCPHDYIIIDELIADGFTDYLVQPIIYTTGETNAASWSSKARRRLQRRGGTGAGADQPAAGAPHRGLPAAGQCGVGAVGLCRAQWRRPGAEGQDPPRRRRGDRGDDPVHRHCRLHRSCPTRWPDPRWWRCSTTPST